jgi:hypothetical protein
LTGDYGVEKKSMHITDNEKGGSFPSSRVAADVGLAVARRLEGYL